jgi:hypothetical protein
MKSFKRQETDVKLKTIALNKRPLFAPDKIYYPGMKNDLYTPFVALQATHVIASDPGSYYHPSWAKKDSETAKFIKFADMLTEMRQEISSIGEEKKVIIDRANWRFIIKFEYLDRMRELEYHMFINLRDFKLKISPNIVLFNEKPICQIRKRFRKKWRLHGIDVLLVNDKRSRVDVYSVKSVE